MKKRRRENPLLSVGFVPLTWELLNSKAYRELPPSSAKALPYFLGKPIDVHKKKISYGYPEYFLATFEFSYKEGRFYGFALATFAKAIRDLVKLGFLDPIDKGGLRSACKSYNRFQISLRWMKYGHADFQAVDWKCFSPRDGKNIEKTSICEIAEIRKRRPTTSKCEING